MTLLFTVQEGPEAVRRIRERGYRGLIIGITGNTEASEVEHFLSQGANAVLAKPVRLESLKAAVEGHVGGGILA